MVNFIAPGIAAPNRAIDHFSAGAVEPVRVKATEYQASSTARFVAISCRGEGTTFIVSFSAGAVSGALSRVAHYQNVTTATSYFVAFVVPPGWYYNLTNAGTIDEWWEVDL